MTLMDPITGHAHGAGGRTHAVPRGRKRPAAPRGWLAAIVFALVLGAASAAPAAEVVGSVTDISGQPIVGAKVEVVNAKGKLVGTGITNAAGLYTVNNLPTGDYTIKLAGVVGGSAMASNSAQVDTVLPAKGETVNWTMAANGSAIATQQAGTTVNNEGTLNTGENVPQPYGAGLTQMGAGAGAPSHALGTTQTTVNNASSSALPAIAAANNNSNPTAQPTPSPASPSS